MAITTLSNYKLMTGMTATAYDSQINALIPQVENDYLSIRNKSFNVGNILTVTDACTVSGDLTVTIDGANYTIPVVAADNIYTVAGKVFTMMSRYADCYLQGVAIIFEGYVVLTFAGGGTGVTATISDIQTIYPIGAELTAIQMITHILTNDKAGVQSESLGDYSVSYAKEGLSYPKSIINRIKRYVSFT